MSRRPGTPCYPSPNTKAARSVIERMFRNAGIDATPERIEELAATCRPYQRNGPRAEAWEQLLRAGELPTLEKVDARAVELKAEAARLRDEIRAGSDGPRAAECVARWREATGAGPTWVELAKEMDWPAHPRIAKERIILGLVEDGWLSKTRQPRSLAPGSRAMAFLVAS